MQLNAINLSLPHLPWRFIIVPSARRALLAAPADGIADVPPPQRWVSLSCTVQNMLLAGTALTSGQPIRPRPDPTCFVISH